MQNKPKLDPVLSSNPQLSNQDWKQLSPNKALLIEQRNPLLGKQKLRTQLTHFLWSSLQNHARDIFLMNGVKSSHILWRDGHSNYACWEVFIGPDSGIRICPKESISHPHTHTHTSMRQSPFRLFTSWSDQRRSGDISTQSDRWCTIHRLLIHNSPGYLRWFTRDIQRLKLTGGNNVDRWEKCESEWTRNEMRKGVFFSYHGELSNLGRWSSWPVYWASLLFPCLPIHFWISKWFG